MDKWPQRKRRAQGPPAAGSSTDERFLIDVARLSTQLAAQLRTVASCVQNVVLLPVDLPLSQALIAAGKEYNQMRTAGGFQSVGPPHLHVWRALILQLQNCGQLTETEAAAIKVHVESATTPDYLLPLIKVCKAALTYDKKMVKLTFTVGIELHVLHELLITVLRRLGGIAKFGPPAKSSHERQVLRHLQQRGVYLFSNATDMPAIGMEQEQLGH
jgi:hypothetical protein